MKKNKSGLSGTTPPKAQFPAYAHVHMPACSHTGQSVNVGQYEVLAGGTRYLTASDLAKADILIPLEPRLQAAMGQRVSVLACPWPDMQPPPAGFEEFLWDSVIPELKAGKKILVYCIGSHGRTGTFLAALIALLEPLTADPIAAVRARHCKNSVETGAQARYVFSLRGQELPLDYVREFYSKPALIKG